MKMIVFIFTLLAGNFVQAQRWEGVWGFDGEKPGGAGVSASRILLRTYKGIYIYPELAEAFIEFAKSPAGYALLAKFGEERQVISKAHEKEIPPFKEDGEYYKIGIDISFVSLNMQFESQTEGVYSADGFNGGTLHMPPSKSGRILFYIRINRELNENNEFAAAYKFQQTADNRLNYIMTRVRTYFHEMVMHAIVDAKDWKDDKKIDLSNISDEAKKNSKDPVKV